MIGKTGIWTEDEAWTHAFSYYTAKYIGDWLSEWPYWHEKPIIDLGCGRGTYLRYFQDRGFERLIGYEGTQLEDRDFFGICEADLTKPILDQDAGHVISIEVFEHIPKEYEANFVENICNLCNGKLILSVAVEGQPGLGHVNCRNNDYVISLFESKGFKFLPERTAEIRSKVEPHVDYLRNTLMVFER